MIIGVGIDIADRKRFERSVERFGDNFLAKIFTPGEMAFCNSQADPPLCFTLRFAAKEAVMKALGIGLRDGVAFRDIEVIDDGEIELHGQAFTRARELGVSRIHASYDSENETAVAVAVLEAE